ncbi:hypothetical protein ACTXT7_009431 [Hymenolepis weldensis]
MKFKNHDIERAAFLWITPRNSEFSHLKAENSKAKPPPPPPLKNMKLWKKRAKRNKTYSNV